MMEALHIAMAVLVIGAVAVALVTDAGALAAWMWGQWR
jgi:hypothetical protein